MNSAIYEGWVHHSRKIPRSHNFRYRVFMPYLRLDEIDELFKGSWTWSASRIALARFKRSDFLGDPALPLDTAVRQRVVDETGRRPSGPIFMLANLRYFGYIMNPICCYYCFAEDGETLEYLVAEVTNTPWNERHSYVLPASEAGQWLRRDFAKTFHVSPFQPMDMQYHWCSNVPADNLILHLGNTERGERVFDATLNMQRKPITAARLNGYLLRYPFMTAKVALAIYWQALRLWLKKIPFYSHPPIPNSEL